MQKKQYFCIMNILLTGVGAPGVQGTLYALRELRGHIIGVDADKWAVGQYLCDEFLTIAKAICRVNIPKGQTCGYRGAWNGTVWGFA